MYKRKVKRGFVFKLDIEYIKQTMDMPAGSKLDWLEEANTFTRKMVSERKRKIWEKFRKGDI